MAKLTELVKTYKLLSDPNAPDWNVKFIGGIAVAFVIIAAAGGAIWAANHGDAPIAEAPRATSAGGPAAQDDACVDAAPDVATPTALPAECGAPAVLP